MSLFLFSNKRMQVQSIAQTIHKMNYVWKESLRLSLIRLQEVKNNAKWTYPEYDQVHYSVVGRKQRVSKLLKHLKKTKQNKTWEKRRYEEDIVFIILFASASNIKVQVSQPSPLIGITALTDSVGCKENCHE